MPTNQQRRDAAKRKLERQLQRREQQDRARRQRMVIIGVVAAVLVISGGVWLFVSGGSSSDTAAESTADAAATESAEPETPCSYPPYGTAAKEVTPPSNLEPLNTGTVDSTIVLNGQDVPVSLNRELSPCGVNSFLSLASQGFYDNTDCHRLTVSEQLNVLQCGDPTGAGNGGPGYTFATETAAGASYPVGTVALANAGTNTSGSQFFIVYGNTTLSSSYTILGTVTGEGMKVVDEIAAQGVQNGAQDGPPNAQTTIARVTVPEGALEGTGTYVTATPSEDVLPSDLLPTDGDSPAVDPSAVDPSAAMDPTAVVSSGGAG